MTRRPQSLALLPHQRRPAVPPTCQLLLLLLLLVLLQYGVALLLPHRLFLPVFQQRLSRQLPCNAPLSLRSLTGAALLLPLPLLPFLWPLQRLP